MTPNQGDMTALVVDSEDTPESVSVAVVMAVANVIGRDPMTIEPLSTVIDPEALNRLFASTEPTAQGGGGRVTFSLEGCEVTVYANGRLEVVDPETFGRAGASD